MRRQVSAQKTARIGLPDVNAHAPIEKLNLDNLHHGMLSAAYLFEELAEAGKGKA
jgi:hypothetical protein